MRTNTPPVYLTKFPISIRQKKHSRINKITQEIKHYNEGKCLDFITHYGYFNVDKKNSITFIITLVDKKRKITYNLKIAKKYIYQSLIESLKYRPVRLGYMENFYVHNNIGPLIPEAEMNKLTPPEIKERYESSKNKLEEFIKDSTNETRKRTAELQLERLIEQQWKMELLYNIYLAEQITTQ